MAGGFCHHAKMDLTIFTVLTLTGCAKAKTDGTGTFTRAKAMAFNGQYVMFTILHSPLERQVDVTHWKDHINTAPKA